MGHLDGKVAIVTGAGRGIGRAEALHLAAEGASVVVNDIGGDRSGVGADTTPAQQVVEEIEAKGGKAVANYDSVADWNGAERLIQQAVDSYGRLDILVNNAGILRDRMSFNMEEAEWDAVIDVHLKGHFAPSRFAGAYWRQQAKQTGRPANGRIINTASESGLFGNAGQANYAAAKAGIAALTIVMARELEKIGVRVNAIAPRAMTRMTEDLMGHLRQEGETFDKLSPDNIAPLVVWLASDLSDGVSGQVFIITGGLLQLAQGWRPLAQVTADKPWTLDDIAAARDRLFAKSAPGVPPFFHEVS